MGANSSISHSNSDFFDVRGHSKATFQLFVIARGTGKTYTGLQEVRSPDYRRFMFMRLTEKEITVTCASGNIFEKLNEDLGWTVESEFKKTDGFGRFYDGEECIGYSAALSTFGSIRGVSFSDVDIIFIDELIPERTRRNIIKYSGEAFANMYESINRNRELDGQAPVKVIMCCNAIDLDNDILHTIGAIKPIEEMLRTGQHEWESEERSFYINISDNVPVSGKKRNTALYKLVGQSSEFSQMALENQFVNDPLFLVQPKVPLSEYRPWVQIDDIYIYRHKATDYLYCSRRHKSKCPIAIHKRQKRYMQQIIGTRYEIGLALYTIRFDEYDTKLEIDRWLYA